MDKRFLVGGIERTVRNGRLNCTNSDNLSSSEKTGNENATYVKRIRKDNKVYTYASVQWGKRNIKEFAVLKGFNISKLIRGDKSATTEGNPYKNFDEDIMGFMNATKETIDEEEYSKLSEVERIGFKSAGKSKDGIKKYTRNITKKRRARLQASALQSISDVKITTEFCTRNVNGEDPIPYTREVYSSEMSSGFILDVSDVGRFKVSDNEKAYRDYSVEEANELGLDYDSETGEVLLDRGERLSRINVVLDALYHMNTNITQTNNLEDLTANFMILADYSLGNAIFNNIFKDGKLDIDLLKSRIEGMEEYRLSKIYVGCIDNLVIGEDNIKDRFELEFGDDQRFVIGSVEEVLKLYKEHLQSVEF